MTTKYIKTIQYRQTQHPHGWKKALMQTVLHVALWVTCTVSLLVLPLTPVIAATINVTSAVDSSGPTGCGQRPRR